MSHTKTKVSSNFMKLLSIFMFSALSFSAKTNPGINNDLHQKVFIENKGQFDKLDGLHKSDIKFVIDEKTRFFFTPKGLTYKFTEIERKEENENGKEEKEEDRSIVVYHYAHMEWVGADPNVKIEAGERSEGYFCFGSETNAQTIIANGYKKITYKGLYPNIDVEYFFHEVEGIKYNIVLHPGANASDIKMRYSAHKSLSIDELGNLHIGVKGEQDIIDHAPITYFQNNNSEKIRSSYVLDKNTVSFKIDNYDNSKTLVIDPWTTNPNFLGNNKAFNIHKDAAGELYVSGGTTPFYIRKFTTTGTFIWSFTMPNSSGWSMDHTVDPAGNSYIGYGPWIGNRTTKVSPGGVQIFNNTLANNTTPYSTGEAYELVYNLNTNRLYAAGYFINGTINVWEQNLTNGNQFGHINATNAASVECRSMDGDHITGDLYVLAVPLGAATAVGNRLLKLDQNLNVLWDVVSGYNIGESQVTYYPANFSEMNGIAVGCGAVYTCDGLTLKKWNKTTGAAMGAPVNVPGGSVYLTSGIIVDPCGDVYVGTTTGVYKYDQNLVPISNAPTPGVVYDLCLGNIPGEIIAVGNGFMNSLNLNVCTNPSANCLMQLPSYSYSICLGVSTILTISNPNNLQNPTYSVQPGSLTSTNNTFVVSPTVPTTYSVYVTGTLNSSVITQSATISVGIYPSPISNPTLTIGTCANPVTSSVNLNITFNPSATNYTTTWSPMPGTVTTVNSPTASGLVPGMNNVTITTTDGCTTAVSFSVPPIPQPASFVVINPSGDYTITCLNPNVVLTTSVTNGVPLTYTWFPTCTNTLVGNTMTFTQSCTGQVVGQSSTGCLYTQTYTVYQDMTSPTIVITPTVNNLTCAGGSGCFTLTSNLGPNVTTNWFQIQGTNTVYVGVAQGTINVFCAGNPGVYWGESVYNITGCKDTKSVQVTASVGVPVFTVTSPTNFTIGCASKSITSMQVTSVITSPVPNVPVNYTFMIPPVTGTPTTFTTNPNLNNITVPGTYVVYVKDLTNNCVSSQSVSIIQNTISPNINFIQPLPQLTCKDFSMVMTGISSNTNTQITWTVPAFPGSSVNPSPNATVITMPSITGSSVNITAIGIWTVGAMDNNNFCVATRTVQINQDIRKPVFTITALTNSVINCKNPDVVIVPVVTPTLAVALVPTYVWFSPVNPTGFPGTSFNTTAPGTHTSISTSVVNGCTYSATYNVATDLVPPPLSVAPAFTLDCNTIPTVVITPSITGSTTGFTYSWTVPAGALTSALTSSNLTTNHVGAYMIMITNTVNGCSNSVFYEVVEGGINASFYADPDYGFAPMNVVFHNTSSTSTGASSIISTWGYGNGAVTPTVYNTVNTTATYTAPGTYSVYLRVQKGTCVDTAMRLVIVEMPSKLEIPNVFTPNGDKANDVFRLRGSSLKEIYIIIFDRWGTKVYEVTSETGNFAWDGKAQTGKECADGVYFYMIKAKGKDGQEFDVKGNVSLFR